MSVLLTRSIKGVGKGTGLGLSMVHGLAEQSGGTLVLTSKPGFGTTAELWLPAIAPDTAEAGPPAVAIHTPAMAGHDTPLSVLVVDDDPLVLSNTAAMLEDIGHSVVTAGSGEAALAELHNRHFDLMVTDHAMPRMTGAQLVRQTAAAYPGMPIIIASGFAELPEDVSAVTRLRKPVLAGRSGGGACEKSKGGACKAGYSQRRRRGSPVTLGALTFLTRFVAGSLIAPRTAGPA